MKKKKKAADFKVMTFKLRKGQRRADFGEVVQSIDQQISELGGDLRNALLVAPKGATQRQVTLALKRLEAR